MEKDNNCIFCKIVAGEVPSYKIYEDEDYIAILDAFPNIKGQTVVLAKSHTDSNAFLLEVPNYVSFMKAVKKTAKLLIKRLRVKRVHLAIEGVSVQHLHAKLYPAVGFVDATSQKFPDDVVHFDAYPGYVTTVRGPKADDLELMELKKRITGK